MTGEELERAIEFLLQSQASSEARIGRLEAAQEETARQVTETGRQLESFADTQAALMQVATETFAAQNRINEDVRRGFEELRRAQEAAWATINRTEASVDRLAETVRLHLEGGNGNPRG